MIYFLQPLDGGPIKIGTTEDIDGRRKQLEAHYGRPLALLATMDGGKDRESEIHARFSHLRFGRTEQFRPGRDLMEFLGRPVPALMECEAMPPAEFFATVKGRPEWKQWLEEAAAHCRLSVSALVDLAVAKYVKAEGFNKRPPER